MKLPLLLALGGIVSVCGIGCGGSPTEGTSADEVRTADCPATFTLDLARPLVLRETPETTHDGATLTPAVRARVAAAMTKARTFRKTTLSFRLDSAADARCTYVSTVSTAPTAPRAELRGTSAQPFIDVTFGDFRWFAFPKTFSPAGFTYEPRAKANLFAHVPAPGPFAEGATEIVKIGSATIGEAPAPAPVTPGSDPVERAIAELVSEEVLAGPGRNQDFNIQPGRPIDMVRRFISAANGDDPESVESYSFEDPGQHLLADAQVAGTLAADVAIREAVESVTSWYGAIEDDPAVTKARVARVKGLLDTIAASGASFGFDGFQQNGCAAPTTFLLVLDANRGRVYGVDMNPCAE